MKKKIVVVFIYMLLIGSVFSIPLKVEANNLKITKNENLNENEYSLTSSQISVINNFQTGISSNICGIFGRMDFGDGSDGNVTISNNTILNRSMNYANLIVESEVTLDTKGFVIKVAGTLTNYGTITDTFNGGDGGMGGEGGRGGDPWQDSGGPQYPESGECGEDGEQPILPQAGYGGDGGGSGAGGGGAWWWNWPLKTRKEDADGGDGGDGGTGGDGGGYVRINAFNFNNQPGGIIHADGKKGIKGNDGEDGKYKEFKYTGIWKDLAGGGGGAGAGGDGGDGGTVEIYYAYNLSKGEIHAYGGNRGNGGTGGQGDQCKRSTVDGHKESGATGACGGGDGGDGEYQLFQWSEDGGDGAKGSNGSDGTVIFEPIPSKAPEISNPNPENGSSNVPISISILSVNISDPDGHSFDWSIETSPNIGSNSSNGDFNGTKSCPVSGLNYNTTYTWYVNATDTGGGGHTTSEIYTFTIVSNSPPNLSYPNPPNKNNSVPVTLDKLSINIFDIDEDSFDWWINCSNGDSSKGTNEKDGTKICLISDPLEYSTTYTWNVTATDKEGSGQTTAETYKFTTEPYNYPPDFSDENPSNNSNNIPITDISLSVDISDKEGDSFNWSITFEEVSCSGIDENNGTKTCNISGPLDYGETYTWCVKATDSVSGETTEENYTFTTNSPPDPPTIDGPIAGKAGVSYDYTFYTDDPEGSNVWYYIDWDDESYEEWIGPYPSGKEISRKHEWDEQGTYMIKAKAKDSFGAESNWSFYEVTMPKNKAINTLCTRQLERFSNIFLILRHLSDFVIINSGR